jgi:hypothetical protein
MRRASLGPKATSPFFAHQHDIARVRNERRVTTRRRGAGKDKQGRPLEKLVAHSTVNRPMQTLRALAARLVA